MEDAVRKRSSEEMKRCEKEGWNGEGISGKKKVHSI
jgi:hypothetical protein